MDVSPVALALSGGRGECPGSASSHYKRRAVFVLPKAKGAQNELRPSSGFTPAPPARISNSDDEIAAWLRRGAKGHSGAKPSGL